MALTKLHAAKVACNGLETAAKDMQGTEVPQMLVATQAQAPSAPKAAAAVAKAPATTPSMKGDRLVQTAPAPTGLGKASLRVAQGGAIVGGVGTGVTALGLMMGAFSRGGIVVAAAISVGAYALAALGVAGLLWSERAK